MATVASPPPVDRQRAERRFYSGMALFLVALMFVGFAPSFFLRGYVSFPRPNPTLPPSVLLHGALFTLWMFVFVAQTQLVALGRRDIHMKLGALSMFLAMAMVPIMYLISVWQVARANQPPFTTALDWTILPLMVIPTFAVAIWLGWKHRRQPQWHKRMMLTAALLVVVGPAFGRLPVGPPMMAGFVFQMLLSLIFFVPLFLWDRRSIGRIHEATWTGFALFATSIVLPVLLIATGTWAPIARYLPGV